MSSSRKVSCINNSARMQLKDVPIIAGCKQSLLCLYHQYPCPKCGKTVKDEVPFAYPGTRITRRAADWVQMLLANRMSVRAIQKMTGIHWDTIHKGHSYAACVLDLETEEATWVGKGRAKADFARFFEEIAPAFLSCVEAVAMDMNPSYNRLVTEHLPNARIVYDRFHMQAQFGKEVLGVVRLAQAGEHQANADAIAESLLPEASAEQKKEVAALQSGIPALMRFAALKTSRIDGLVSHARFPISTGKLEGFSNKVKLVKRIAFSCRDETFFFALVRFFSSMCALYYFL